MTTVGNLPRANLSVCAIVLNYFGAAQTAQCLENLSAEGLSRILVVDNSADPIEWQQLQRECQAAVGESPDTPLAFLQSPENLGFGAAINETIRVERERGRAYKYYLLLNNDAKPQPHLTARLVSAMEKSPNVALASPIIQTRTERYCFRWYKRYFGHHSAHPSSWTFPYVTGCCLLVRGSIAAEAPLFDEAFFMYGEDIELCWRQAERGHATA